MLLERQQRGPSCVVFEAGTLDVADRGWGREDPIRARGLNDPWRAVPLVPDSLHGVGDKTGAHSARSHLRMKEFSQSKAPFKSGKARRTPPPSRTSYEMVRRYIGHGIQFVTPPCGRAKQPDKSQ
jgi:hypothetical protein